jgi:hypothetical protein
MAVRPFFPETVEFESQESLQASEQGHPKATSCVAFFFAIF